MQESALGMGFSCGIDIPGRFIFGINAILNPVARIPRIAGAGLTLPL
jgi:hypothetical protein